MLTEKISVERGQNKKYPMEIYIYIYIAYGHFGTCQNIAEFTFLWL